MRGETLDEIRILFWYEWILCQHPKCHQEESRKRRGDGAYFPQEHHRTCHHERRQDHPEEIHPLRKHDEQTHPKQHPLILLCPDREQRFVKYFFSDVILGGSHRTL
jgi:hypothetical protein